MFGETYCLFSLNQHFLLMWILGPLLIILSPATHRSVVHVWEPPVYTLTSEWFKASWAGGWRQRQMTFQCSFWTSTSWLMTPAHMVEFCYFFFLAYIQIFADLIWNEIFHLILNQAIVGFWKLSDSFSCLIFSTLKDHFIKYKARWSLLSDMSFGISDVHTFYTRQDLQLWTFKRENFELPFQSCNLEFLENVIVSFFPFSLNLH